MKIKSRFIAVVISIILSLLGALLGASAGLVLYRNLIPPWKHYEISPLQGANDILQIDIKSTKTDPTEDVLYVATEDGKLFFNTLFQADWVTVASVPEDNYEFPLCATEWRDHPPVKNGIVDSAGVRFERPISTILRCYVLFDDGSLQVWIRSRDVYSMMIQAIAGGMVGLIVGITISVFIWRRSNPGAERA